MKPDAPKEYRSPHGQIRTSCPDIEFASTCRAWPGTWTSAP
ncbi:MAG: hypothetical protein CM1200mP34_3930 [Verrucomicrobiales bacterium]|nr:MAG: hypothetical protein CM1200mP34_3930 [Verrucomicrobiales bacterium]